MSIDTRKTDSKVTTAAQRAPIVAYLRTRATITVDALQEDDGPEGHFASGDDEHDARTCAKIREDYNDGNPWAWTCVRVTATFLGFEGTDYLGGCSYESQADFQRESGYYGDMVDSALDEIAHTLILDRGTLAELADEIIRGCMSDAGLPTDLLDSAGFQRGGMIETPTLAPVETRREDDERHGQAIKDSKLGALVRATIKEYSLGKTPDTDADGFEKRTVLGDALRRDGMSTLLRTARERGLI